MKVEKKEYSFVCPECNEIFCLVLTLSQYNSPRRKKYCSVGCAKKQGFKKVNQNKKRKFKPCKKCGSLFSRSISGSNMYCVNCKTYSLSDPNPHYVTARRRLLLTREHKCEMCGLTEWLEQPIPLQMDHIDGNSDNNNVENLRLLCPNCHYLTPTWGRKNNRISNAKRNKYRKKGLMVK